MVVINSVVWLHILLGLQWTIFLCQDRNRNFFTNVRKIKNLFLTILRIKLISVWDFPDAIFINLTFWHLAGFQLHFFFSEVNWHLRQFSRRVRWVWVQHPFNRFMCIKSISGVNAVGNGEHVNNLALYKLATCLLVFLSGWIFTFYRTLSFFRSQ